jgi:carbonic anhydrase
LLLALGGAAASATHEAGPESSSDVALARLMAGNQRYMHNKAQHPDESPARRKEVAGAQHPFAVILGCADSRVAPELLFDQGLGDLFVIRVAGNILDDAILGSIEYAVEHLGTKLILVLGHEKCGAVTAAIQGSAEGHITALVEAIRPVVAATAGMPGDKIHNCVVENARRVAREIRESEPVLKEAGRHGMKVVAADYALDTGAVTLLEER